MGLGWTPLSQQSGFTKQPVVSQECPVHKVAMTQKTSKTSGKLYFSHSEGIYPNLTMCFGKSWQVKPGAATQTAEMPERQYQE